ncbi:MAG: GntR family transcriptional regulator [Phyllobacterium sp.]
MNDLRAKDLEGSGLLNTGRTSLRSELVYRILLDAIKNGEIKPGDRITEEEIAHKLSVSRTPVRAALQSLQARRLIENAPGRGLMVAELDTQQVLELYSMRAVLEGAAARFAAQHASESEIAYLQQLVKEFAESSDTPHTLANLNVRFHRTIYAASRNRYVQEALNNFEDALSLLQSTTFSLPERHKAAYLEHNEIIRAIANHDSDKAEAAARHHIGEAQKARVRMMLER